jgi:hypothetical protein
MEKIWPATGLSGAMRSQQALKANALGVTTLRASSQVSRYKKTSVPVAAVCDCRFHLPPQSVEKKF